MEEKKGFFHRLLTGLGTRPADVSTAPVEDAAAQQRAAAEELRDALKLIRGERELQGVVQILRGETAYGYRRRY